MTRIQWQKLNPIVNGANYLKSTPCFQFGPRYILNHQFIYVVKGRGKANIQGREYVAEAGDLFYYGPHVVHCFQADKEEPFEVIGVHFQLEGRVEDAYQPYDAIEESNYSYGSIQNQLFIGNPQLDELKITEYTRAVVGKVYDGLIRMVNQFRNRTMMSAVICRSEFIQVLLILYKEKHVKLDHLSPQQKILYHVRSKLDENADHRFDRNWLRSWSGYHEDYISQAFHNHYGLNPHKYHMLKKMDRAKELLEHTELSISDIAETLSFQSIHYFCRVFKASTDLTPTSYKRLRKFI